jgi:regulatory protein
MARPPFPSQKTRAAPRPLDRARLGELALSYVARFATSEVRLKRYLTRKLRERGWDDETAVDDAIDDAVARCVRLEFVNDGEYARMRGGALTRRGLGAARVRAQLSVDGIAADDAAPVLADAASNRLSTAVAFARRRRLGPFGSGIPADRKAHDKAVGAFMRAGHDVATARRILMIAPDDEAALAELDGDDEAI